PPAQRIAYALLARTLEQCKPDLIVLILAFMLTPVLLAVGTGLSLVVMTATALALRAITRGGGPEALALLYLVPFCALIFARGLRQLAEEARFDFALDNGRINGWRLGRLHDVFHAGSPATLGLFFGCVFGFQWGLLYHTADH